MSDETQPADEDRDELAAQLAEVREKYEALLAHGRWQGRLLGALRTKDVEVRAELQEMTASRDNFERLCTEWRIEFDALHAKKDDLQAQMSQCQVEADAVKQELGHAKGLADTLEQENASLQDTVQSLRKKQIHADLPGLLAAIQGAVEQARELI